MPTPLSGQAQTVLGPIAAEAMGVTLPHEHLLIDFEVMFKEPSGGSERGLARQPVSLANLGWVRQHFSSNLDNLQLLDEKAARDEALLFKHAGGQTFVAPDNGLLTMVFKEAAPKRVVELTERRYARPDVSRTFEGRDRFAPAAAWLAKGIDLTALGRPLTAWHLLDVPAPHADGTQLSGVVLRIDRFGNLVTNIDRRSVEHFAAGKPIEIAAAGHPVTRLVAAYADADAGSICALFGSSDHLEIAVTGGSAAARLGLTRGAPVVVRFGAFP